MRAMPGRVKSDLLWVGCGGGRMESPMRIPGEPRLRFLRLELEKQKVRSILDALPSLLEPFRALLVGVAESYLLVPAERSPRKEREKSGASAHGTVRGYLRAGNLKRALFVASTSIDPAMRRRFREFRSLMGGPPLHRPAFDVVHDPHSGADRGALVSRLCLPQRPNPRQGGRRQGGVRVPGLQRLPAGGVGCPAAIRPAGGSPRGPGDRGLGAARVGATFHRGRTHPGSGAGSSAGGSPMRSPAMRWRKITGRPASRERSKSTSPSRHQSLKS